MFAAQSEDIGAVVSFYGTLILPPAFNRKRTPFDVIKQIRVPGQGHYGTRDANAHLADARRFEEALQAQNTPAEIFSYEAGHGFFAFNREETYRPEAARPVPPIDSTGFTARRARHGSRRIRRGRRLTTGSSWSCAAKPIASGPRSRRRRRSSPA